MPVLGVCLGLQALAMAHGAAVHHAPYPVHGNLSGITHSGHPLFKGIPSGQSTSAHTLLTHCPDTGSCYVALQYFIRIGHLQYDCLTMCLPRAGPEFAVVRYHSLAVPTDGLPACLEPIAWARGVLPAGASTAEAQKAAAAVKQQGIYSVSAHCSTNQHSQNGMLAAETAEPEVLMGLAHRTRPHYAVGWPVEIVNGAKFWTCYPAELDKPGMLLVHTRRCSSTRRVSRRSMALQCCKTFGT